MKMIWKQKISHRQDLELPAGSKALKVGQDPKDFNYYLWFICDPTKPKQKYRCLIFGTGWEIHEEEIRNTEYFDTVILNDGLVWHFYLGQELIRRK